MMISSLFTLETGVDYDKKSVTVTRLIQWFKADFGGAGEIKKMLEKQLTTDLNGYKINYSKYHLDAHLGDF